MPVVGPPALTQEEELPALPVEAQELPAVLLHRRAQAVLAEQEGELLDLLRRQLVAQLR